MATKMVIEYRVEGKNKTKKVSVKELMAQVKSPDAFSAAKIWLSRNVEGATIKSIGMATR